MRLTYLILFLTLIGFQTPIKAQEYLWPTDSGTYLSATFGETRSAHFHAGLDIKTWGREGYRVFAARDGILYRLLVTERGYGNAIYLKHPDNTFTTYAHLQRFNSSFQALADSVRLQNYTFEMDENYESQSIPVKKGDVIGYTGSTGIGPPHLHFEIRDSLDKPINALSADFPIKDDIPPVFSSLIIEPISKDSRVNGKPVSYFINARNSENEHSYSFGNVRTKESVGLAVNVYDQANDVYNAYAIHQLTLMQGADTLFHEELSSFDFAQEEEMFLDRIAPFGSDKRGHQRLYGKDGHNNPFYLIDRDDAQITASKDEPTTYTIIAQDYFGNTSSAKVTIIHDSTVINNSKASGWLSPQDWYWTEDWFSPDQISTINFEDLNGYKLSPDHKLILNQSGQNPMEFLKLRADSSYKIDSKDRNLRLRFNANTFFDTLMIATNKEEDISSSTVISILPGNTPLKKEFIMEYFLGDKFETGKKYGFYRIDPEDGDLSYVDSQLRGKTLVGFPNEFGDFKIMGDEKPPQISNLRLVNTEYGKWFVVVEAIDEESGIDSSDAVFKVNGIRGIAEYDYEEELLRYYHPDFNPESRNTVSISIKDKAGNVTLFSDMVTISGQ